MSFVSIMQADELMPGEKAIAEVYERKILLVNLDGKFFALDNRCPHLGGSLGDGMMEKGRIVCPRHHAIFDLKTGECLGNARIAFISMKVKNARSIPVKVEKGNILVDLD